MTDASSSSPVGYVDDCGKLMWINQMSMPDNSCSASLREAGVKGAGLWSYQHTWNETIYWIIATAGNFMPVGVVYGQDL